MPSVCVCVHVIVVDDDGHHPFNFLEYGSSTYSHSSWLSCSSGDSTGSKWEDREELVTGIKFEFVDKELDVIQGRFC